MTRAQAEPEWISAYLSYLQTQKRVAELTLVNYHLDLLRLWQLSEGRDIFSLNALDFKRFAMAMHGQGLSGHSIARNLSAWRGLYRWLAIEHHLAVNPVEGVKAPKSAQRLPKALSVDQVMFLLDTPCEAAIEIRDQAMFELFYSSGLRLAELISLNVEHAEACQQGLITVTGKRQKTRTIPVGSRAINAVQAWMQQRALWSGTEHNSSLFLTRNGKTMSPSAVRSRLDAWAKKCGLGMHVHPHMLRHSFASHVLQSSGDLRAVQEMLGHASIQSTQVYTHLDFQHLAAVYDAAHPRAKKRRS